MLHVCKRSRDLEGEQVHTGKCKSGFHRAVWHPLTVRLLRLLWARNCGHEQGRHSNKVYRGLFQGDPLKEATQKKKRSLLFSYILFAGFLWYRLYSCSRLMTASVWPNFFIGNVRHLLTWTAWHHTGHYYCSVLLDVLTATQRSKQHLLQVLRRGIFVGEYCRSFMLAGWIVMEVGTFAIALNLIMEIKNKSPTWTQKLKSFNSLNWTHLLSSLEAGRHDVSSSEISYKSRISSNDKGLLSLNSFSARHIPESRKRTAGN